MRTTLVRTLPLLALLAVLAPAAAGAQDMMTLFQQANEAQEAGQHARAAELFDRAYAVSGTQPPFLYFAAGSWARAGVADSAFARLQAVVRSGFAQVAEMKADSSFAALHGDPRWAALVADAEARRARFDLALRDELLRMVEHDQKARQGVGEILMRHGRNSPQADSALNAMNEADQPIQARLREIVRERGWPLRSLVADDGAHAAWLMVQHADSAYQREVLPLVLDAAARGEARPADAAYLEDRVRVNAGRPQLYGTQLTWPEAGGKPVVDPIEDEPCVDRRRAKVGMGPLADYLAQQGIEYTRPGTCAAG